MNDWLLSTVDFTASIKSDGSARSVRIMYSVEKHARVCQRQLHGCKARVTQT